MIIKHYHVPKSGGTAIYNMTNQWKNFRRAHPRKNHVQVYRYPPKLNETGLAVIRHPYSRFVSAFYHMVDSCNEDFYYRHANQSDCNTMKTLGINMNIFNNDPNQFLEALVNVHSLYHKQAKKIFDTFSIFKSQFYWLGDIFGFGIHPGIKIILHQERLKEELDPIIKQLGYQPNWPTGFDANKRISHHSIPLTQKSKEAIQSFYKDDFKHFKFLT